MNMLCMWPSDRTADPIASKRLAWAYLRVAAHAEAIDEPGANRDDVLERAAQLNSNRVLHGAHLMRGRVKVRVSGRRFALCFGVNWDETCTSEMGDGQALGPLSKCVPSARAVASALRLSTDAGAAASAKSEVNG